jgi:hypothetical protein
MISENMLFTSGSGDVDDASSDTNEKVPGQAQRNRSDILGIRLLSVALVSTMLTFTFYALVTEGVIDISPPYPSEETPLTLQTWGITWNREYETGIVGHEPGLNYSDLYMTFKWHQEGGSFTWSGLSITGDFINASTFTPPSTIEAAEAMNTIAEVVYGIDGSPAQVFTCCIVSDVTNASRFNFGDSISFVHLVFIDGELSSTGFPDDGSTFEVVLESVGELRTVEGYGFAVHDGDLYSWVDHGPVDDPLS